MIKVIVAIPDTPEAKESLNKHVIKIMKAHGAEGNDFFEIYEEKPPRRKAKKAEPKISGGGGGLSSETEAKGTNKTANALC
jgi:hypothetical protein